ncbi:MAG TPA: DUF423 domain-containing protein [Magnetospirillum sp.]|nr:DUF423 domain-containing protein [Magnetospirillum sp.]
MRPWVLLAGVNGLLAVGFGAYAAHGLAGDPHLQALADRASQYQLVHAVALLAADRLAADGRRLAHGAAALFVAGMVLFSGSLYLRALTGAPLPVPMVTPAGGMAFMGGWLMLAVAGLWRRR